MTKFFPILLSFFLFPIILHAQSKDAFEIQMNVYKASVKNFDLFTAASALYNALAIKPERKDLKDSLAFVYFTAERYPQALTVGEEILKDNPNKKEILEVIAISKQSLGLIKESLADYETIYKMKPSVYYLYQIATLQFQLKRIGECLISLDQIIANPDAAKEVVSIRTQNNESQKVPLKAAALNVKGIIYLELNKDAEAKGFFQEALSVYPEFVLPKGNLGLLEKRAKNQSAVSPEK